MSEDITARGAEIANTLFQSNTLRFFIFLLASICLGYVLQPVPVWLNTLFNNSDVFKYIILVTVGICATYPVDGAEIFNILVGSFIILALFKLFRTYDDIYNSVYKAASDTAMSDIHSKAEEPKTIYKPRKLYDRFQRNKIDRRKIPQQ